jgi:hypothetical protein
MALDFTIQDIIHKVLGKFIPAYLPEAKKPYYLKAVLQPELDIHEVASKADVYNIETNPKVIEDGFIAASKLMLYLVADGYKIKTPLFTMYMRFPGEYMGSETHLVEGAHPEVRLQASQLLRDYIGEKVHVEFDGFDNAEGLIAEAIDENNGHVNATITEGNILTVHGYGLKIESDAEHAAEAGFFFENDIDPAFKAEVIAVNEPKTLKVVVPAQLSVGKSYYLKVITQSSPKASSHVLKNLREMRSDFKLKLFKREAPSAGGEPSVQA